MTSLGHRLVPSLLVNDMEATLDYYIEVLGFRLTGRHPTTGPSWAEVSRDGITFQFHTDPPVGTPAQPVMSGTFYVYPESVTALVTEWEGRIPFVWGPQVMEYGMREFAIQDPNGYFLAFAEAT